MARTSNLVKTKKTTVKIETPVTTDFYGDVYTAILDKSEKDLQIVSGMYEGRRLSTGILVLDMITGLICPTMYTISGMEGSAKTTITQHVIKSIVNENIPIKKHYDPENAVDAEYSTAIYQVKELSDIYGERGTKGWKKRPKVRYYDNNILETVFDDMQTTLNALPDKLYRHETKKWYLVFHRKTKDIALMKEMQAKGLSKHDKKLYTETGMYFCDIGDDDRFQAAFFMDSWPQLVAEKIDSQEKDGNALAIEASQFSKYLKRVRGKLRRKRALLWGCNQIAEIPMARGSPFKEKGGNSLRYASDVRNELWHRAESGVPNSFKEIEPSVFKKKKNDTYAYKFIKNTKNKKWGPKKTEWLRVWTSDHLGKGRGVDPVWDVWRYLLMTNQLSGKKEKFTIKFKSCNSIEFSWSLFKALILSIYCGDKNLQQVVKDGLNIKKIPDLRSECFAQIASGEAFELQNGDNSEFEIEEEEDLEVDD